MQVVEFHAGHQLFHAGEFIRAIKTPVAVPLIDHIMMFGV